MKPIEQVDARELQGIVKEFNGLGIAASIRVVGISKEKLRDTFIKSLEDLDSDKQAKLTASIITFYNAQVEDETIDTGEDVPKETAPQEPEPVKEKKEKKEKKAKEPKEKKERKMPEGFGPRIGGFKTFDELVAHINASLMPTVAIDRFLLEGGTLAQILEKMKPEIEKGFKGNTTVGQIMGHIRYRMAHGYRFEITKQGEDDFYKLVGYEKPQKAA